MEHPFEVGEEYRNRNGRYEVLAINDPKMAIRYEDGHEDELTIAVQARIWAAIQLENQQQKSAVSRAKNRATRSTRPARQGYDFSGLQDSDFKDNVTGTHWRSRASLGGRLAQLLSETTAYPFQSHAVSRRPSVYITIPDHYDPEDSFPYAKNRLWLTPDGALYGLYVERPDQSRTMDSTWHWRAFMTALENNGPLRDELAAAMRDLDLFWRVEKEEGGDSGTMQGIDVRAGSPLLWNDAEQIDWPEFVRRLQAVSSGQWLNVHLAAWTPRAEAIAAGGQFADQVARVFRAVLPLYVAAAGVKGRSM